MGKLRYSGHYLNKQESSGGTYLRTLFPGIDLLPMPIHNGLLTF
jgi:hypothetical protein